MYRKLTTFLCTLLACVTFGSLNMDYRYSVPIEPSTVKESGCFTTLPVRRSISAHEDIANKASESIVKWVFSDTQNTDIRHYSAGLRGHAIAITIPEFLPDRIEQVAQFYDLGFIHDGKAADSYERCSLVGPWH
jgi:hypothetical protein